MSWLVVVLQKSWPIVFSRPLGFQMSSKRRYDRSFNEQPELLRKEHSMTRTTPPNWIYSISSILYLPVIPYLSCSLSLCFRFRSYDKTRLLALYFISKPDLDSAKKKKLIDAADLPAEEAECIQNLDLPALKEIAVRRTTCSQSLFP